MTRGKLQTAVAVALCALSLRAATVQLPMPRPDATGVAGAPRLFWSLAGENVFPQGDFEEGSGGWGGQVVTATPERPALQGTNYLRLTPFGTGSLQTSCRIALPNTTEKLIWSFGVAGYGADARIYSTNGPVINGKVIPTLLVTESFTNYGANSGWGFYSMDVSAFAGQTIILAINFGFTDGISREIDDVRVTIQPRDVAFDVYLDNVLLGRTTNNWWQLKDLTQFHVYSWRVDAIEGGARIRGPGWRFTTASGWPAQDIRIVTMPASVCPGTLVPVEAFVRDLLGLRTPGQSGVRFTAFAENVASSQIVISEIDVGDRDGIEFINASTNTLSLSGSSVQILAPSNAIPVQTIRFPTGSTLAPGQMFTIVEGGQNVWPEMRMTNVNWGDAGLLQAGVVLRNVGSNVIDCAFIDLTAETNKYHHVHLSAVSELDWRSDPIVNVAAGQTVQRFRNRDFNNREDWTTGAASFGAMNTGLTTPFDLGFGPWNLAWTNATKVVGGTGVTTAIQFPSAAKNVQIVARQSSAVFGISEPFDVVEPAFCLSLLGPTDIREDAGTVDVRIALGSPAASDVIVNLSSSNPGVLALPTAVTIPAGASEAVFAAQVINNDLLEGRKTVSVQASAPSYTPATLNASAMDDETATLQIVGP
ncbi:MAG TPA: lamin tail domain-containing protein, partial [Verrucomicrobiae bacterium]|nr:lamin tail domain-containing protein [Verrucomicrobiae bacterium]